MKQNLIYDTFEFQKKQSDYCICVFVINEGERLLHQLELMKSYCRNLVDVVVADGGSTDGSTNADILQKLNVNTLLVKRCEGKLGTQMRMAFDWALKRDYQGVLVVDGNGKDGMFRDQDLFRAANIKIPPCHVFWDLSFCMLP